MNHKKEIYLRDVVWDVLLERVKSAREIMDWLQGVAKVTAKANHTLRWSTPSGFAVTQQALEFKDTSIYTLLQRIRIHQANDEGTISPYRQQRCMPPNFVHSHDAAHAHLTINEMRQRGLTSFSFIHDDYGTHCCDVDMMDEVIRYQFVRMYDERDILRWYWNQWREDTGLDLEAPPDRGGLDLMQVLDSPYFFG